MRISIGTRVALFSAILGLSSYSMSVIYSGREQIIIFSWLRWSPQMLKYWRKWRSIFHTECSSRNITIILKMLIFKISIMNFRNTYTVTLYFFMRKSEDSKGVRRNSKSKRDRQFNVKKKVKQETNNYLRNTPHIKL